MSLRDFISKQFIDVIDWVEPEDGILAYRYPMQDREIQNGGKLTVRDSQLALFVNEGKVADSFGPGLYTLNTQTLPILTYLKNWDKAFQSPFKSDVYYFSARTQTDQHWGTPNPITIRDKEFGAIRLRGFGIYSYHLADAKMFYSKISGTRDLYRVADLEGQLRNTIVAKMTDAFATSQVPFLDMAANQGALAQKISDQLKPAFAEYGISMDTFVAGISRPPRARAAFRRNERGGGSSRSSTRRIAAGQLQNSTRGAARSKTNSGTGNHARETCGRRGVIRLTSKVR